MIACPPGSAGRRKERSQRLFWMRRPRTKLLPLPAVCCPLLSSALSATAQRSLAVLGKLCRLPHDAMRWRRQSAQDWPVAARWCRHGRKWSRCIRGRWIRWCVNETGGRRHTPPGSAPATGWQGRRAVLWPSGPLKAPRSGMACRAARAASSCLLAAHARPLLLRPAAHRLPHARAAGGRRHGAEPARASLGAAGPAAEPRSWWCRGEDWPWRP